MLLRVSLKGVGGHSLLKACLCCTSEVAHLHGWQLMLAVAEGSAGSSSGVIDWSTSLLLPHVLWASFSVVAMFSERVSQEARAGWTLANES